MERKRLKYHPTTVPGLDMTHYAVGLVIMHRWSCQEVLSFFDGIRVELHHQMLADRARGYTQLCVLQGNMLASLEALRTAIASCNVAGERVEVCLPLPYWLGVATMQMRYDRIVPLWSGIFFGLRRWVGKRFRRRLSKVKRLAQEVRRANVRMFLLCAPYMEHEFLRENGGKLPSLHNLRL